MNEVNSVGGAIVIIVASVIIMLQNHKSNKNTKDVKTTLTENNGGSSVKDRLDSLDKGHADLKRGQEDTNNRLFRIENILMGRNPDEGISK